MKRRLAEGVVWAAVGLAASAPGAAMPWDVAALERPPESWPAGWDASFGQVGEPVRDQWP